MTTLLAIVVDTTIMLGGALLASRMMTRRPAALRHAIVAAAVLGSMLVPMLERIVPPVTVATMPRLTRWPLPDREKEMRGQMTAASPRLETRLARAADILLPSDSETAGVVTFASPRSVSAMTAKALSHAPTLLAGIWALGVAANLVSLLLGLLNLRRLRARCSSVDAGLWREVASELGRRYGLRRRVAILQSDDPALLVACGVLRPAIVLPAGAATWTEERVRIVLAHELAHVRRLDGACQLAAEVLRGIHWFNPLAWMACRRLRQESEYACDDAVLSSGTDPSDYASHLLAVAKHARGFERVWAAAPGITHPSTLERRIAAMLQSQRNRGPLTRRTATVAALVAVAVIIPLAAASVAPAPGTASGIGSQGIRDQGSGIRDQGSGITPGIGGQGSRIKSSVTGTPTLPAIADTTRMGRRAEAVGEGRRPGISVAASAVSADMATPAVVARQATAAPDDQTGTIVGSVKDQSGAAVPGATVTMTSTDLAVQRQTVSDGIGAFAFGNVQPARYAIAVSLAGFETITAVMTVQPRTIAGRSFALPIGVISESITVNCGAQAIASPRLDGAAPNRIERFSVSTGWFTRDRPETTAAEVSLIQKAKALFYPTLSAQALAPVRVGGLVQAPQKLTDARPACSTVPRTDTTVVLVGRIGTDGALRGVRSLRPGSVRRVNTPATDTPEAIALQELTQSAIEAVSGWTFTPARLNGQNVDIDMTIQVTFRP